MTELKWEAHVPIFRNRIIVKQLGLAIGLPFGILLVLMGILRAYYGILIVLLTLIFTYIFVILIFKGTYDVRYILNKKGIYCANQPKQENRVKKLSFITFILGILTRNLTAAGAGILSGTNTKVFIPWRNIRKTMYIDKYRCIMIYGGFAQNIALFCMDENYDDIKTLISENMKRDS